MNICYGERSFGGKMTREFVVLKQAELRAKEAEYTRFKTGDTDGRIEEAVLLKTEVALPYIKAALRQISEGKYGVCLDCEEQIPEARLELVPAAIRCRECQQLFEEK